VLLQKFQVSWQTSKTDFIQGQSHSISIQDFTQCQGLWLNLTTAQRSIHHKKVQRQIQYEAFRHFNKVISTGSKHVQPSVVDTLVADSSDKFRVDYRMVRLYLHTRPPATTNTLVFNTASKIYNVAEFCYREIDGQASSIMWPVE